MKPISPPKLIKTRADMRHEYAEIERQFKGDPTAKNDARLMRRFNKLGSVLKLTGGKHVHRHAAMQTIYDAAYAEAVTAGVTRGKAHSHALGKVHESHSISDRQLQRVIIRRDYRPRRARS